MRATDGNGHVVLSLSQKWFLADGSPATEADGPTKLWPIPVFVQLAGDSPCTDAAAVPPRMALMPAVADFELSLPYDGAVAPAWVKLNAGQHVPLRVCYPAEMVTMLAADGEPQAQLSHD